MDMAISPFLCGSKTHTFLVPSFHFSIIFPIECGKKPHKPYKLNSPVLKKDKSELETQGKQLNKEKANEVLSSRGTNIVSKSSFVNLN